MVNVWTDKRPIKELADMCFPMVTPPVDCTYEQMATLFRKWKETDKTTLGQWSEFVKSISGTIGMDGAIVVQWQGMYLCIESDGYCHS